MELNPLLQSIVAKHFKLCVDEISLRSSKDDIDDWDSLEHIKLLLEIEEEFAVRFSLEIIPKLTSVSQLQKEIEQITARCSKENLSNP